MTWELEDRETQASVAPPREFLGGGGIKIKKKQQRIEYTKSRLHTRRHHQQWTSKGAKLQTKHNNGLAHGKGDAAI
jgi:hypothetical protein